MLFVDLGALNDRIRETFGNDDDENARQEQGQRRQAEGCGTDEVRDQNKYNAQSRLAAPRFQRRPSRAIDDLLADGRHRTFFDCLIRCGAVASTASEPRSRSSAHTPLCRTAWRSDGEAVPIRSSA